MRKILLLSECSFDNPTFRSVLDGLARNYASRGYSVKVAAPIFPYMLLKSSDGRSRKASWGPLIRLSQGLSPTEAVTTMSDEVAPLLDWADQVHMHVVGGYTKAIPEISAALRARRIPALISFHDWSNPGIARTPEAISGYSRLLRGRQVTTLSRFGRKLLLKDFPSIKGRLDIVPEGVWLEESESPRIKKPFVLCPAWLAHYKAPDILMMAWTKLKSPPLLIFTGFDPQRQARALAERLGLIRSGKVRFAGPVNHRRMLGLMAACEFAVLPSRHEFFGIAALEAMALGKAVIAGATGPADFIKDGASGLLVPPGEIAPLERALKRLLADRPLRRQLGRAAQRAAQSYSWSNVADLYLDMLARTL